MGQGRIGRTLQSLIFHDRRSKKEKREPPRAHLPCCGTVRRLPSPEKIQREHMDTAETSYSFESRPRVPTTSRAHVNARDATRRGDISRSADVGPRGPTAIVSASSARSRPSARAPARERPRPSSLNINESLNFFISLMSRRAPSERTRI